MRPKPLIAVVGALAAVAVIGAATSTAGGTAGARRPVKQVIATPVAVPAQPLPGDAFSVSLASRTEPAGKIAFDSDRDGIWKVFLASADGTSTRRLPAASGYYPAWSPDGTRLAYNDGDAIYVTDATGRSVLRIGKGHEQAWSPDGTRLAFVREGSIYVANADGTGERQVTHAREDDVRTLAALPSWSPDGTRVAFETFNALFLIGADGSGERQLAAAGVDIRSLARPAWSPDGSSLAYITSTCCAEGSASGFAFRSQTPELKVVGLANGSVRSIASDVEDRFVWSPDGTKIAFARPLSDLENAPTEIFSAPVGGGASTQITHSVVGEDSWAPSWSPDGGWLAYMRARFPTRLYSGSADVALIRADGTDGRQLTQPFPSGGSNEDPVWTAGAIEAQPAPPPAPPVAVQARGITSDGMFFEVAASGSHAAALASTADLPVFWVPGAKRITRSRPSSVTGDAGDFYGLVMTSTCVAWFSSFAHGVVDPVTDVTLVLTNPKTRRSLAVTSVERAGHNPPYATGPRLAGDGSLLVYNPDRRGSKLYRVGACTGKPKLRLLATNVAVADVDRGRVVGWRGTDTLVTLAANGSLIAKAALARTATTSVRLEGARLFTTAGNQLALTDLRGTPKRTWQLVDEGGPPPTLAGVDGDVAVYLSGVAVHVLRLSTGSDVVLALATPGPAVDLELTPAGLFYAYNAAHSNRPGRLGFVALGDLKTVAR